MHASCIDMAYSATQEYFLKLPETPHTLSGFHISSLPGERECHHLVEVCL